MACQPTLLPALLVAATLTMAAAGQEVAPRRTNVILVMADDQGWGDTAYNGHPVLLTPNLDAMAREGALFSRFYSAAPVCSPTRGSCLTGRHPLRYGIRTANDGHLPDDEPNLAAILRANGYATGHFGKWHLGTLTRTEVDSNRGGRPQHEAHYAPPWERGFGVCFSTEAKVPTFDPLITPPAWAGGVRGEPGSPYGTSYWVGEGKRAEGELRGDDSRLVMDRALTFVEESVKAERPFFAVVWFHAPHLPVIAGPEMLRRYGDRPGLSRSERHYYGCITALDEQMGRLRRTLAELGVAEDTMLWYCSDNGPEGADGEAPGSTGGLRGRKRSLHEGGIRVPGLLVWPRSIREPVEIGAPCSTLDYLPTVLAALGLAEAGRSALGGRAQDGIDLMPLLRGERDERGALLCFRSARQLACIDEDQKLVHPRLPPDREPATDDAGWELYDLDADPAESRDLARDRPERVERLARALLAWHRSCTAR